MSNKTPIKWDGSNWGSSWIFEDVDCPECLGYISTKPLCKLCQVNHTNDYNYCAPCCCRHFEEQKAKYPELNPMY